MSDHQHYYVDRSGGFGWPACVICGKPVPADDRPFAPSRRDTERRCCGTHVGDDHTPTCASLDARKRRLAVRDG